MSARFALIALTALAAALRFYGLGSESLWLDEAYLASRIEGTYWQAIYHHDIQWQGVLFPLLEKIWCDGLGRSEFALRFLPALLGTLAIPALYRLGALLISPGAGLLAACLLAINPFAIHYSQDARPYTLFLVLTILALEFAVRSLREYAPRVRALFILLSLSALYVHPFGIFLFPLLGVLPRLLNTDLIAGELRPRYYRCLALIAALYLPMLMVFARSLLLKTQGHLHDADFIPPATPALLADMFAKYFMSGWTALLALGLIVGVAIRSTFTKQNTAGLKLPLVLLACFILIPAVLSWGVTPILFFRYTIPALAAVLLMLGWALSSVPLFPRVSLLLVLSAASGFALADYYTKIDKDPWWQTAAYMRTTMRPGDRIVVKPGWLLSPLSYYLTPQDSVWLSASHSLGLDSAAGGHSTAPSRFWIISAGATADAPRADIETDTMLRAEHLFSIRARDSLIVNPRAFLVRDIRADLYRGQARFAR